MLPSMTPIPALALLAQQSAPGIAIGLSAVLQGGGTPPEWIELFPPGRDVNAVDGRAWLNDSPEGVVAQFKSEGRPLAIDQDHALDLAAPKGLPAPAVGWIEELQVRTGGSVWGRVSWTSRGAELLKHQEYRYISPAFNFDPKTKRILRLASASLTNNPALRMTALSSAQHSTEDATMDKDLLKALGLPETATAAEALAAVNKLKSDLGTALATVAAPPLDKFVPRADYDKANADLAAARNALKDRETRALAAEIETEINAALAAKKITPATADYHKAQCKMEGGLARFREFVKAAPVVAADSGLGDKDPAKGGGTGLTPDQLAVCQAMNLAPEDYKKALA